MKKGVEIITPYLLLCEGADEEFFLRRYLNFLIQGDADFNKIQVVNYGGINELTNFLKVLARMNSFEKVAKIAIIRDAETNWQGALDSIASSVNSSGISRKLFMDAPYLFPNKDIASWQNGTLEDLCVKILKEQFGREVASSVLLQKSKEYLNELEEIRGNTFSRVHKNLLHTILSSTDTYVGLKIGEAAKAGAFDWESEYLNGLKHFLLKFVKE